jgi:hypothetical protein
MRTSSHGSFRHALAANMHQRASSGVGIIATPFFPYSSSSVWNRNQLAGLGGLDITTMAFMAVAAYLIYKNKSKLGF